ncbi:MAG: hypothetical protein BA870_10510 [Desulfuromonadales bacterium C00003094]|jgi:hypothetical protein|nr:MAG: hypothetical protein BA870_10510 [Desulfuromonadales bacterium C00003094]
MSKSNRSRSIDGVGAVIGKLFQQRGMEDKMRRYRAWQLWDKVVGPQIAARARPSRMRDNTLEVWVDHAVWMQQLQLMKPKILARLNAALGEDLIQDIYLRRGRPRQDNAPVAIETPTLRWQQTQLSAAEEDQISRAVAPLADAELRQVMQQLFRHQAQVNKARQEAQDNPSDDSTDRKP